MRLILQNKKILDLPKIVVISCEKIEHYKKLKIDTA